MSETHAPDCAREAMRHADDSTAYLSESCTCRPAPPDAAVEGAREWLSWAESGDPRHDRALGLAHVRNLLAAYDTLQQKLREVEAERDAMRARKD